MTPLRQRLLEDLQLRGLSERTQEMEVRAVRQLAEHDHQSPAQITEEALRDSFLSVKHVQHSSRSASTIALCGITFFYERPLKREWTILTCVRPPQEHQLPVVLSLEAVHTLLQGVRLPRSRACLSTISACGLRLQEGTHLQGPALARARMVVPVRNGTGAQDRSVPLPQPTLARLRPYWTTYRHPVWLFPAPGRGGSGMATAVTPMPRTVCRTPGAPLSRPAASTSAPRGPRCATPGPRLGSKPACICASSSPAWDTPPPIGARISRYSLGKDWMPAYAGMTKVVSFP